MAFQAFEFVRKTKVSENPRGPRDTTPFVKFYQQGSAVVVIFNAVAVEEFELAADQRYQLMFDVETNSVGFNYVEFDEEVSKSSEFPKLGPNGNADSTNLKLAVTRFYNANFSYLPLPCKLPVTLNKRTGMLIVQIPTDEPVKKTRAKRVPVTV